MIVNVISVLIVPNYSQCLSTKYIAFKMVSFPFRIFLMINSPQSNNYNWYVCCWLNFFASYTICLFFSNGLILTFAAWQRFLFRFCALCLLLFRFFQILFKYAFYWEGLRIATVEYLQNEWTKSDHKEAKNKHTYATKFISIWFEAIVWN